MSFTDDDLKRLKSEIREAIAWENSVEMPGRHAKALLARLEAAEAVCQQTEIYITDESPNMFRMKDLLKAWRKAAGK